MAPGVEDGPLLYDMLVLVVLAIEFQTNGHSSDLRVGVQIVYLYLCESNYCPIAALRNHCYMLAGEQLAIELDVVGSNGVLEAQCD